MRRPFCIYCRGGHHARQARRQVAYVQSTFKRLLEENGIAHSVLRINDTGWDFHVCIVDERWVLRVPRNVKAAAAMQHELRLLKALADKVSFAIPNPYKSGQSQDMPYAIYPFISGRPFRAGDNGLVVAQAINELHHFPVVEAAQLLQSGDAHIEYVEYYRKLRTEASEKVEILLPAELRHQFVHMFDRFLDGVCEFEPTLVHRDLGSEHVLMNQQGSKLVGIIDFGDAVVGDPAIDFVGILITAGPAAAKAAIAAYGKPISWSRVCDYYWLGPVHAILHGIARHDPSEVNEGISGLSTRLNAIAQIN